MSLAGHLSRRRAGLVFLVGAAAVLFAAYGHVLTRGPFGINDDYQFLYRTHGGGYDPWHSEIMGMGRPINSWGVQLAYGPCAGRVARLVWLRALALVGIGVFAWMLCRMLVDLGFGRGRALTTATLAALTPACGVYAAWAATMFAPWALCGALGAGWLLACRPAGWRRDLAAGGLILLACGTWQAAAPLAMFPALAAAWRRVGGHREPLPTAAPWWRAWLVGGIAVGVYGVLCVLVARYGAVSPGGVARLAPVVDPAAKARFFFAVLLRGGVTSWARLLGTPWQWAAGAGTVAACALALPGWRDGRWRPRDTAARAGLAVFMVAWSVAPLLAAREDNGAFRSLICLYVTVIFLGVEGVSRLLDRAPRALGAALAGLAVAASVGVARYGVWHGLVEPSVREYVGVREEIRRQFPDGLPPHLVYLVPPYRPLASGLTADAWEYGLTSSPFWWVTRPFLVLAAADALPGRPVPADLQISYREAGNPGVPVLQSLPALLREEGQWRDDAIWGRVRAFRGGWLYSPWFGYFNVAAFPYIQHHYLGGLIYTSQAKDGHDLWFYHEGVGQFCTNPGWYPHLLLVATGRWVTPSDDPPLLVYLSDDRTHERLPYYP